MDGDGQSTFGDVYFFNWWLEQGGSLSDALLGATASGSKSLIDLTAFFASSSAQLGSALSGPPMAGPAATQSCPQPIQTRRLPPFALPQPDPEPLDASVHPRTTPDGRFVVFSSKATNLPGGNGKFQVYRYEHGLTPTGGTLIHVSKDTNGASATEDCLMPSISNDGTRIVFHTRAVLHSEDSESPARADVYLIDVSSPGNPQVVLVSPRRRTGAGALEGDSFAASISGDGGWVAFTSRASDLHDVGDEDTNEHIADVLRARVVGTQVTSIRVASRDNADPPTQSVLADMTTYGGPVPIVLVQGVDEGLTSAADDPTLSVGRVINDDGQFVVMHGTPCDWDDGTPWYLCPELTGECGPCINDCSECEVTNQQVYLRDFDTAETSIVSRQIVEDPPGTCDLLLPGDGPSRRGTISGDGTRIAFSSFARNLRPDLNQDADEVEDVFFIDVVHTLHHNWEIEPCPQPIRVSVPACRFPGPPQAPRPIDGDSFEPMLSWDGTHVVFASEATVLLVDPGDGVCPDTNDAIDVFVRDTVAGTTARYSIAVDGAEANDDSRNPDITGDGRRVVYESVATNLLGSGVDSNSAQDVFQSGALEGRFIRGDANLDATVDISDGTFILNYLFLSGPAPECRDAADANDDGGVNSSDPQYIYNYLFLSGDDPKCPFSGEATSSCCGVDPTPDTVTCAASLPSCTLFMIDGTCP